MRISHESIYRDLYMPSRKVFDASMFHRLRTDRPIRVQRWCADQVPEHARDEVRVECDVAPGRLVFCPP